MSPILLLILLASRISSQEFTYNLLDGPWTFRNRPDTPDTEIISGTATVPGDIYADLQAQGIIEDPLYADNDVRLEWVPREEWTYETEFDVVDEILKRPSHLIVFDGLDTIARVVLNGEEILTTNNQFIQYTADVTGKLNQFDNKLEINFDSPISYSAQASNQYMEANGYSIPPDCPKEEYHGECHVNYIRKIQASFSWDWGPSFPTVGIFGAITLVGNDYLHLERVYVDTVFTGDGSVTVEVNADVRSAIHGNVHWNISIPQMNKLHTLVSRLENRKEMQPISTQFTLKRNEYELWWPNGMGEQKMYEMTVRLTREDNGGLAEKRVHFGIRSVELVQDYIDTKNHSIGRDFYFKINGEPVFLKGSNWIPVSSFPARDNSDRMEFLLESARSAGMNAMRVWGGGRYETDQFYEMADQKGLLLWQDMMFACALYPTDPSFLASVSTEIEQNVKRLKSHPSVLVWAGNNENELALADRWYRSDGYNRTQEIADYDALYVDLIGPIVTSLDPSRPFLASSPSNGIESDKAGGVAKDPADPRYGDIHYYDYVKNLWKDSSYQTPRCATEYGVQSLPSGLTMSKAVSPSEYSYLSGNFTHRQHHPGGTDELITMIFDHFPLPEECETLRNKETGRVEGVRATECVSESEGFLDRLIYFTQFHQAITYKTETEHYLRYRGLLTKDGHGHTMCALYWQLNDVWAAPTWSTIDADLRWKPSHYESRRFFSPQMVVLFLNDDGILEAFIINDRPDPTSLTVVMQVFAFSEGFDPVYKEQTEIDVLSYSSTPLDVTALNQWLSTQNNWTVDNMVFTGELLDSTAQSIGYQSTVVPDRLWKTDIESTGDVHIESFDKISDMEYKVGVTSTGVAPFVWIELKVDGLLSYFSDNAFTMTASRREVTLILTKAYERDLTVEDVYVCSLKSCYVNSSNGIYSSVSTRRTMPTTTTTVGISTSSHTNPSSTSPNTQPTTTSLINQFSILPCFVILLTYFILAIDQ